MNVTCDKNGVSFTYRWRSLSDMERCMAFLTALEKGAENDENMSAIGQIQATEEKCLAAIGVAKLKGKPR